MQDDLDLYFTDPQQLLDLVTELTQQNLSLFNISTTVEKTLKELQQSIETTKNSMWASWFVSSSVWFYCYTRKKNHNSTQ